MYAIRKEINISMNNKCPKCGSEMQDLALTSLPPIYVKRCYQCGYEEKNNSTFALNNPCKTCPNHTQNGGSGVCGCTLGIPKIN